MPEPLGAAMVNDSNSCDEPATAWNTQCGDRSRRPPTATPGRGLAECGLQRVSVQFHDGRAYRGQAWRARDRALAHGAGVRGRTESK
jgi:hypothetical protein